MRVNLFLVGSQKCGTSTLHDYLRNYFPTIYMAPAKETFYFTNERALDDLERNNFEFYHQSHFSSCPDGCSYIGESSTHYTMQPLEPSVAQRIHLYNPDAKILYIVRDPVDRAVSNYWHSVSLYLEGRSMVEAFKSDPQYIRTGDYLYQIKPYFDCFPAESIRILFFKDLINRPTELLRSLSAWLGVPLADGVDSLAPAHRRPRQEAYEVSSGSLLSRLKYSSLWRHHLRPFVPPILRRVGKPLTVRRVRVDSPDLKRDEDAARKLIEPVMKDLWDEFVADDRVVLSSLFQDTGSLDRWRNPESC
jgi:hypothetical protein